MPEYRSHTTSRPVRAARRTASAYSRSVISVFVCRNEPAETRRRSPSSSSSNQPRPKTTRAARPCGRVGRALVDRVQHADDGRAALGEQLARARRSRGTRPGLVDEHAQHLAGADALAHDQVAEVARARPSARMPRAPRHAPSRGTPRARRRRSGRRAGTSRARAPRPSARPRGTPGAGPSGRARPRVLELVAVPELRARRARCRRARSRSARRSARSASRIWACLCSSWRSYARSCQRQPPQMPEVRARRRRRGPARTRASRRAPPRRAGA